MKYNLDQVPHNSGCYMWLSNDGEILYVGKAKDLKKRMSSYNNPSRAVVSLLMREASSFDFITTKNELDSLILEQTLVNKHEPKYNIRIKYSSTYPYIKIDKRKGIKVMISNKVKKIKGVEYYGPFPEGYGVTRIIKMIKNLYPIDKCLSPGVGKPCLNHQMGRCLGYCIKEVSQKEIDVHIQEITNFLKGDIKSVFQKITSKIEILSLRGEYEEAIVFRDYLRLLEKYQEKQTIQFTDHRNVDIFAWYIKNDYISISISIIRFGNLVGMENHIFKSYAQEMMSDIESFVSIYYIDKIQPQYIFSKKTFDCILKIIIPKKSNALKILEETEMNATLKLNNSIKSLKIKEERFNNSMNDLKKIANLSKLSTIELSDISSTQGDEQVGVVVSYKGGNRFTGGYRKYVIKDVKGMDDYASMEELAYRHFKRKIIDKVSLPNLFIVDGKYQVNVVQKVLHKFKIDVKVIGIIKNSSHDTNAVFVDGKVITLKERSPLYLLLGNMQDEVHRFAINFHRQRRTTSLIKTELNKIKQLSEYDINKLYSVFGSIRTINLSSKEELSKVVGLKKAKLILKK